MKKYLLFKLLFLLSFSLSAQKKSNTISGVVTDLGRTISNVNIIIKGSDRGTKTDAKGNYSINASPGDVLIYSYVGMQTTEIIVEDVTTILNIQLTPKVEELKEVVVERQRKSQIDMREEYATNKKIIKTSIGYIDKDRVGYSMQILEGAHLNPGATDILSALLGKFPNISVRTVIDPISGFPERGLFIRGGNFALGQQTRAAVYEVDGSIFKSAPTFVSIESIDRIAIIPGQSSMARYGNIAAGGMVIINTKDGVALSWKKVQKESPKRSNSDYVTASTFKREAPKYLIELQKSNTKEEALETYNKYLKLYDDSPYYYLDASTYFIEKWQATYVSNEILGDFLKSFENNPNALKALAYIQEEQGNLGAALETYKMILRLRPRYAQSYRDLANAYVQTADYRKALSLYARYETSRRLDTITSNLDPISSLIRTESNNLVTMYGDELTGSTGSAENFDFIGTRLVFEWNNSEAEFEMQFVKPDYSNLTWSHTLESNPNRIRDEKTIGYSSEQFLVAEDLVGKWHLNLKYFGNKGYSPTYLKVTTFLDYGASSQRQKTTVYKLTEKNINQELFTFINNPLNSN